MHVENSLASRAKSRRASRAPAPGLSVCALLAAGCATIATPYQPDTGGQAAAGGYSEERLTNQRFHVTFSATPGTPKRLIEAHLLRRCAELTLQEGFDWFELANRTTQSDVHVHVAPDNRYRVRYGSGYSGWKSYWRLYRHRMGLGGIAGDPLWWTKGGRSSSRRIEAVADIVLEHGMAPNRPTALDARSLLKNLEGRSEK
jgi:hypothetical protein